MSKSFITDVLLRSTGAPVRNIEGKKIGEIAEITRSQDHEIEYIIIESDVFFGNVNRFFAIPASPRFIDISKKYGIVLQLDEDDIQFARGVAANKCPKPNLEFGKSIYELYGYSNPARSKMTA